MIKKVLGKLKQVFIPKSEFIDTDKLEAPIFSTQGNHFSHGFSLYGGVKSKNHSTVPAPVVTPTDNWFSEPVKTEKVIAYEKHVAQKIEEQKFIEAAQPKKEPENIHQAMYEKAIQSWGSWQETLGGSENFHEGPGGWNSGAGFQSGTGYNQFRS